MKSVEISGSPLFSRLMRRVVIFALGVVLVGVGWWLMRPGDGPATAPSVAKTKGAPRADVETSATTDVRPSLRSDSLGVTAEVLAADYPIVAPLNRADSTIARDLETVARVLDAWRSNFPREGNPFGENAEITAALAGENRLGLVLIPRGHPAINGAGELCDRWGTPFRFHQISGHHMEIRSAGPDRKFATADDVLWNPAP